MRSLELKVPPLALTLACAGAMWLASPGLPTWRELKPLQFWLAVILSAAGLATALAGVQAFRRHQTTMNPLDPGLASRLVSSGIYRVTRNPVYLGFALMLAGWVCILATGSAAALLAGFVWCMNRFQIGPEERAMTLRFGDEYRLYMTQVRRWV